MPNKLDLLFFLGRPLGPIYGSIMKIRESCYSHRIFRQTKLPVPVISVGNLVLGGTGKTPTVVYLASLLVENGYRPAVVSRGYKGKSTALFNIVSSPDEIIGTPENVGDEPVMMARALPGVPVLTGMKRSIPCKHAVSEFGSDIIILDDGYQHLGVARDINITLFDSTTLAGNSRIFPAGPLREPVSALQRTSAFLMTGKNEENSSRSEAFAELLKTRFPGKPVFSASSSQPVLTNRDGETIHPGETIKSYLFCGIGNPERFFKSVADLGIEAVGKLSFEDHSQYNQSRMNQLCRNAEKAGAQRFITTAKDFVKLETLKTTLPIHVLHVKQRPQPEFAEYVLNCLQEIR